MWFKEYVFNVLIQPVHLLLYTILVGSAISLATESIVYAVIAMYFLVPAEKLIRKFFGFDNAGTLSAAGSFAGGALFSSMVSRLNRKREEEKEDNKPKTRKPTKGAGINANDVLLGGDNGSSSGSWSGRRIFWRWLTEVALEDGNGAGTRKWPVAVGVFRGIYDNLVGKNIGGGGVDIDAMRSSVLPNGILGLARENFGNRMKNVALGRLYDARSRAISGVKKLPKNAGRFTRRAAIGGLTGGAAALAALGAGAATGDGAKAAALMAGAAGAGYNFGNFYGDKGAKSIANTAKAMTIDFWGQDMKKINQYKFDEEFKNSPEVMMALTQALGTQGAKEALKNGDVQALLNSNITDPAKLAKAVKLKNQYVKDWGEGKTGKELKKIEAEALKRTISVAQWNRDLGPEVLVAGSQKQAYFKKFLRNSIGDSMSEEKAQAQIQHLLNEMEFFET